jgi:hypothetical protein
MPLHRLLIVGAALLACGRPAGAQDVQRTIDQYDTEVGVMYAHMSEEGGFDGHGVLVDGGYRLWTYRDWRLQGVAEGMIVRFGDFDAAYKQVAAGARMGRLFSPRLRLFGQVLVGVQNDGFEESNAGVVIVPGGGAGYALTERFDAQVMADFPAARYSGRWFNQFRLSLGVGMPLGAH